MHPAVFEIDLHTVDIGYPLTLKRLFDSGKDSIDVDLGRELQLVFGYDILRILLLDLADLLALVGHKSQEQRHTDQSIAAIVGLGIDNPAITFAADNCAGILHCRHNVDLPDSGGGIAAAVFLGHIAQGAARAQVAHRSARSMTENIVGHGYESIFLDKHLAVLHDDCQTVDIWIDNKTDIGAPLFHKIGDLSQILGNRFGSMAEPAGHLAVKLNDVFYT